MGPISGCIECSGSPRLISSGSDSCHTFWTDWDGGAGSTGNASVICSVSRMARPRRYRRGGVDPFLTHLAEQGRVSASTQNQALAALLFLHRGVPGASAGSAGRGRARATALAAAGGPEPAGSQGGTGRSPGNTSPGVRAPVRFRPVTAGMSAIEGNDLDFTLPATPSGIRSPHTSWKTGTASARGRSCSGTMP